MNDISTTGPDLVAQYLEGEGIPFQLVEHPRTTSALGDARATHRQPQTVGKTVVLHDASGYVVALVPADRRVDLGKLREVLGASRQLQLVDERDMAEEFGAFEVGAFPPLGLGSLAVEVIDSRLLEEDRILCAGGDHMHSVLIDPRDIVALTRARVADISAE
jgi:Ala-tRNA(Pro) deacylase